MTDLTTATGFRNPRARRIELIAKTLYDYNRYGKNQMPMGDNSDWPPAHKPSLNKYLSMAEAVYEAIQAELEDRG